MEKFLAPPILAIAFFLIILGCAPVVKTDLESLNQNPEKFEGKEVIVVTDLASLVERPSRYVGKRVEVQGYVEYKGFWAASYWNFILKDEAGNFTKCFERHYRVDAWMRPVAVVRRAERKNRLLTVVGKVETGPKIELDWIEYEGDTIDTDLKPAIMVSYH